MHETPHANPADVLETLLEGNRRFVGNARRSRDLPREVRATAGGQDPSVAIVGCIDSRAAGELVLDLGIGDAFNIRLAGNIVDAAALGSLEYACGAVGTPLVLVLGHTGCGAVKAACDAAAGVAGPSTLDHLSAVIDPILEAVVIERDATRPQDATSGNPDFVDRVARLNVHRTILDLTERSSTLAGLVETGRLGIAGAMYDVASGRIEVIETSWASSE